jgi:hypothetical protein
MPGQWVRNALWRSAKAVPSLDLRFADSKSLVDSRTGQSPITFTRASSATFIDSAGTLQTAAVDVPRFDHNPTTGESLGLLVEEQRTNLLLNTATLSTQSVTVTAVAHTLSFYGSGTVTLSGASTAGPAVGSGAFPARTTLTFTPSAGTLTLTVTGSVTSAQLEAGAFATSYIPTTAAAATRSADVASITGQNFSSWYRQDEGTVYVEGASGQSTIGPNVFASVEDGSLNNRIQIRRAGQVGVASMSSIIVAEGAAQANLTGLVDGWPLNSNAKAILSFLLNNIAQSLKGAAPETDNSASIPAVDRLLIGSGSGVAFANGTICRLTYWPQRLAKSTLQAITQ